MIMFVYVLIICCVIYLKEIFFYFFCMIEQIDEDLIVRINMGDYKFFFYERGKFYVLVWMFLEGKRGYVFFFRNYEDLYRKYYDFYIVYFRKRRVLLC